jgi:hypothetical protein
LILVIEGAWVVVGTVSEIVVSDEYKYSLWIKDDIMIIHSTFLLTIPKLRVVLSVRARVCMRALLDVFLNVKNIKTKLQYRYFVLQYWYTAVSGVSPSERRSGRIKPEARVLIPLGYLHLGKRKH